MLLLEDHILKLQLVLWLIKIFSELSLRPFFLQKKRITAIKRFCPAGSAQILLRRTSCKSNVTPLIKKLFKPNTLH